MNQPDIKSISVCFSSICYDRFIVVDIFAESKYCFKDVARRLTPGSRTYDRIIFPLTSGVRSRTAAEATVLSIRAPAHSFQNDLALFYCLESATIPDSRLLTVCAAEAPAVRAFLQVNHWLPYKYMAEPEIEVLLRNREIQRRLQMARHGIPCSLTA